MARNPDFSRFGTGKVTGNRSKGHHEAPASEFRRSRRSLSLSIPHSSLKSRPSSGVHSHLGWHAEYGCRADTRLRGGRKLAEWCGASPGSFRARSCQLCVAVSLQRSAYRYRWRSVGRWVECWAARFACFGRLLWSLRSSRLRLREMGRGVICYFHPSQLCNPTCFFLAELAT